MKESDYIKKHLKPLLESLGFKVKKHTERFSSGWPDISAVHKPEGTTVYIEAKIFPARPTKLQVHELCELAEFGAHCYIFTWNPKNKTHSIDKVLRFETANISFVEFRRRYDTQ